MNRGTPREANLGEERDRWVTMFFDEQKCSKGTCADNNATSTNVVENCFFNIIIEFVVHGSNTVDGYHVRIVVGEGSISEDDGVWCVLFEITQNCGGSLGSVDTGFLEYFAVETLEYEIML